MSVYSIREQKGDKYIIVTVPMRGMEIKWYDESPVPDPGWVTLWAVVPGMWLATPAPPTPVPTPVFTGALVWLEWCSSAAGRVNLNIDLVLIRHSGWSREDIVQQETRVDHLW